MSPAFEGAFEGSVQDDLSAKVSEWKTTQFVGLKHPQLCLLARRPAAVMQGQPAC